MTGAVVIKILSLADGRTTNLDGQYLRRFDVEEAI